MTKRARLDAELVRRGLARSRAHASELIDSGRVTVRGTVTRKAASAVEADAAVLVADAEKRSNWASRGAHKLLGALAEWRAFGLSTASRRCLDAGASAGGFTDVLLAEGARQVVAADVGRGLLAWRLATDPRVVVRDKTNVRYLTSDRIGGPVELVVADLSFISLGLVLPALAACMEQGADLLPLVKPQFEVGKGRVGPGGVVRDPRSRADAVRGVIERAAEFGLAARGVVASPLPGPSGNVEYFTWLSAGPHAGTAEIGRMIHHAISEGPE
jgi:23S rRNA (cytidine1920-2'-O)/16S rRNA (cytidine1409-2'-O)-methyltransferase